MAEKQSTPAIPKTEKPESPNDEADRIIGEAYESLGRFARMMDGLNTFCSNVERARPEYAFAFAVATIADLIKRDAEEIRAKLGKIVCGGRE